MLSYIRALRRQPIRPLEIQGTRKVEWREGSGGALFCWSTAPPIYWWYVPKSGLGHAALNPCSLVCACVQLGLFRGQPRQEGHIPGRRSLGPGIFYLSLWVQVRQPGANGTHLAWDPQLVTLKQGVPPSTQLSGRRGSSRQPNCFHCCRFADECLAHALRRKVRPAGTNYD